MKPWNFCGILVKVWENKLFLASRDEGPLKSRPVFLKSAVQLQRNFIDVL